MRKSQEHLSRSTGDVRNILIRLQKDNYLFEQSNLSRDQDGPGKQKYSSGLLSQNWKEKNAFETSTPARTSTSASDLINMVDRETIGKNSTQPGPFGDRPGDKY
jgi:hypothetical protein